MYYIIQKYMPKTTKQNTKQAFNAVLTIFISLMVTQLIHRWP